MNYIHSINNYFTKINQSREYDEKENRNGKKNDELNLSKNQIEQKRYN